MNTKTQNQNVNAMLNLLKVKIHSRLKISLLILSIGFAPALRAQYFNNVNTANFDYPGPGTTYNDVGEDVTADPATGNYYVVGEFSKDNNNQGIHIMKYNSQGTLLIQTDFSDTYYKEYVKKIKFYYGNLYIICNAVDVNTGVSSLLAIRFAGSLLGSPAVNYFASWHDPVDMYVATNSAIYVACYKRTGTSNELGVVKLSCTSAFSIITSYTYHYNSVNDNYQENPKQIAFNPIDQALYVVGGIINPANYWSATFITRLSSTLVPQWTTAGIFDSLTNIYNSVIFNGNFVYAAGTLRNGGTTKWVVRRFNKSTGSVIANRFYSQAGYNAQALKITFINTSYMIVVGSERSVGFTAFNIRVGKINSDLTSGAVFYGIPLTVGSTISDAVSALADGRTYITGSKHFGIIGATENMFFLGFDPNGTGLFYKDSIINSYARGNKIVYNDNAFFTSVAVTGYTNNNANSSLPDLKMTTRFYNYVIPKLEDTGKTGDEQSVSIFPQPATDHINIRSSNTIIESYSVYDSQGKTVLTGNFADTDIIQQLDISSLPRGMYFISLNNGKALKLIKK